jgi:hypothetical protein
MNTIKRFTFLLALLLATGASAMTNQVTLAWIKSPADTGQTNWVYRVYHATNIAQSLPWTRLAAVPAGQTNVVLTVVPGEHFFYLTMDDLSGGWGESNPSNIAGTPAAATTPAGLTIRIGGL